MKTLDEANLPPDRLDRDLLREVKEIVLTCFPGAEVALFGSRARGTAEADSDFDVLVLVPSKPTEAREALLNDAIYELELQRGVVISLLLYASGDWNSPLRRATPFHKVLEREGLRL